VAAALGVVHYWWLVKLDTRPPRNYAIILAALLLVRVWASWKGRRSPAELRRA
jgi:DMSO/TMAO reductase YedYZ heme-binding membrane subunit